VETDQARRWGILIQSSRRALCEVHAWGQARLGQLGLGERAGAPDAVRAPAVIPALQQTSVVAMACGGAHALALMGDGSIYAWGDNAAGQLGTGDALARAEPAGVALARAVHVRQVAASDRTSAALTAHGDVLLWGDVTFLVPGERGSFWVPRELPSLAGRVWQIALGPLHAAAVTFSGAVLSWGLGCDGQLGHGDYLDRCCALLHGAARVRRGG